MMECSSFIDGSEVLACQSGELQRHSDLLPQADFPTIPLWPLFGLGNGPINSANVALVKNFGTVTLFSAAGSGGAKTEPRECFA